MSTIKIFIGPAASGKSRAALKETANLKGWVIDARGSKPSERFLFSGVDTDTRIIIIDDVPVKRVGEWISRLSLPILSIEQKGQAPTTIPTPNIIITTQVTLSEACAITQLSGCQNVSIRTFPEE